MMWSYEEDIEHLTLTELNMLQSEEGKGIMISYQSNGDIINGDLYASLRFGDMDFAIRRNRHPAWITEIISGREDLRDKHFSLRLSTNQIDLVEIEVIEECLYVLLDCDIYRDGGSYEAKWLTNYGRKWELFLKTSSEGMAAKDYAKRHTYLYKGTANGPRKVIMKNTDEDSTIKKMIEEWLDKPIVPSYKNRDVLRRYKMFSGMYYAMPWRMY